MIPLEFRLKLDPKHPFSGDKLPFFSGTIISRDSDSLCWAISISKKALPLATGRNLLRRQLQHYLYQHRRELPQNKAYKIIITRPPLPSAEFIPKLCSLLFTASSN